MGEIGCLYLVATPIGNLGDFSPRGQDALNDSDLLACEDTRVTSKLLSRMHISKPMVSYREENEKKQAVLLTKELEAGKKIALVSDAGYPGVSDPGFRLVRECRRKKIRIIPIPGPNAAVTALAASGLPTHNFLFLGFPPKGKVAFINLLTKWEDFEGSLIFYQSRYKMPSTFESVQKAYGNNRYLAVARELTKLHESIEVGSLFEVWEKYKVSSQKGEFTLVIAPKGFTL